MEKGGGFAVSIFLKGWVLKSGLSDPSTHISMSHTVHNREIWGVGKGYVWGMVHRIFASGMGACSIRT